MAHIILVHGSWHWAGCFHKLEPQLRSLGHTVESIDNASHGTDTTAWDAIDSMATYTATLRAAVEASSEPVILVGHSMGGVSLSYLAEEIPSKIAKLVYLTNDWAGIRLKDEAPDQVREAFYGDCSDEDVAFSAKNATLINTSIPNIFTPTKVSDHERHYIHCTKDRAISLQAQQEMCAEIPGIKTHSLETCHSPFYSQPEALAKIIDGISI